MKVTHGIDHSFYKMFISLIQNYNFKVWILCLVLIFSQIFH
jgi:hypothetical protein